MPPVSSLRNPFVESIVVKYVKQSFEFVWKKEETMRTVSHSEFIWLYLLWSNIRKDMMMSDSWTEKE